MTIGIAAICDDTDGGKYVFAAADRMVTHGREGGIEHESPESKIEQFYSEPGLTGVAIGSGPVDYLQKVMNEVHNLVPEVGDRIDTERDIAEVLLAGYQQALQSTVSNQILQPLGFSITDLRDGNVEIPDEIQSSIEERAANLRSNLDQTVTFIAATADETDAGVYVITGAEIYDQSSQGYAAIGSGNESAKLTFIRRRYDKKCSHNEALFTIMEAKQQSEERQGVGQQMDIIEVNHDNIHEYDESDIEELRELLDDIEEEERKARENVMNQWDK